METKRLQTVNERGVIQVKSSWLIMAKMIIVANDCEPDEDPLMILMNYLAFGSEYEGDDETISMMMDCVKWEIENGI